MSNYFSKIKFKGNYLRKRDDFLWNNLTDYIKFSENFPYQRNIFW